MADIFDTQVVVYPNRESKEGKATALRNVLNGIKKPKDAVKNLIIHNRTLKKGESAYDEIGSKLPLIQFNTVYESGQNRAKGEGLLTGLMYLDADTFADSEHREEFKNAISTLPFILSIWTSRGGKGFGMVAAVNNLTHDNFSDAYCLISSKVNELTDKGFEMDMSCANHNRGNYMSFDKDIDIFTEGVKPFDFRPLNRLKQNEGGYITDYNNSHEAVSECEKLLENAGWGNRGKYWARPGKSERSVSAQMNLDNKYDKRFKVYTDGASLPSGMYSMFDLLMHFKFEDNYDATKEYVAAKYGKPIKSKQVSTTTVQQNSDDDLINSIVEKLEIQRENKIAKFPCDCLPESIRNMVSVYSAETGAPDSYVFSAMLATIGAATRKGLYLKVLETRHEYPLLWVCVTGAAGDGKTFPLKRILKVFREQEMDNADNYDRAKAAYEADLQEYEQLTMSEKKIADAENRRPVKVIRSTFLATSGGTAEGLVDMLGNNKEVGFMFADEFMGLLNSMNSYKGGKGSDQQMFLDLWSMGFINKVLATKDTHTLKNPFLPIIGGAQILKIIPWLEKNAMDDGFFERVLWAVQEPEFKKPNGRDTSESFFRDWDKGLDHVFNLFAPENPTLGGDIVLRISHEAKELKAKFIDEVIEMKKVFYKNGDAKRSEVIPKLETYMFRIAVIIWLLDEVFGGGNIIESKKEINKDQLNRAIKIVNYYRSTAFWLLGKMEISDDPHELSGHQLTSLKKKLAKQAYELLPTDQRGNGYAAIIAKVVNQVVGEKGKVSATLIRQWRSKNNW